MPLVNANEPLPDRPAILLLYGDPGVCKTSLANTTKNPILLDFDRGVDRSHGRKTTLIPDSWQEVIDMERNNTFQRFNTVIIDTAKACLDDYLMVHVCEKNYRLIDNKLQAYGAIGDAFKLFVNNRRAEKADLVIIAHAKKDDDDKKFMPDVTGQSSQLLLRIADQVGYITMKNGKRVITFDPKETSVGKNVAGFGTVEVPDINDSAFENFGEQLLNDIKTAIAKKSKEELEAIEQSKAFQGKIQAVKDISEFIPMTEEIKDMPKHIRVPLYSLITDAVSEVINSVNEPDELTKYVSVVNDMYSLIKNPVRKEIARVAELNSWVFDTDKKMFVSKSTDEVGFDAEKILQEKCAEVKIFAKKLDTAEAVYNELVIAKTKADMVTLHKYNKDIINDNKELKDAFTKKLREVVEGKKK